MANDTQVPVPTGKEAAAIIILALQHFEGDLADSAYFHTIQRAVQALNGDDETIDECNMSRADAELVATAFPQVATAEVLHDVRRGDLRETVEALAQTLAAEHGLKTLSD